MNRLANAEFSTRAFIAAAFTITSCYMFATQVPIPSELMVLNTAVIIDYFRSKGNEVVSGVDAKLPAPYIPDGK